MSTSAPDADGVDQHVETSPNGRYIRYKHVLGKGAYKTVYKAFDTEEALEVAWNKLHVDRLSEHDLEKVSNEVSLLRQVTHKNIIHFYDTWRGVDGNGNQTINFITEQMMSGTLKEYLKRAKAIKLKVIRRWCRNILEAIAYLHSRNPPIMHRDLKCDNIFINGHVGEVKIGDLGLSGVKEREKADSVIGTPEFMAPELYEESYTEKVDIYAFGMCLLEMVSMEYPYSECNNMAQIFKKVFSGEKPRAYENLVDGDVKDVIAACLQREARRPSAVDLLGHPLFQEWEKDVGTRSNLSLVKGTPESVAASVNAQPSSTGMPIGMQVIDWSDELGRSVLVRINQPDEGVAQEPGVQVVAKKENGGFFIWLEVPIRDAIKRVEFNFDPFQDSAERIAQEMVAEFQLSTDQIEMIREEIDRRVQIAKSQRAEASRNATPQPAHRQIETNVDHVEPTAATTQTTIASSGSISMTSQTTPAAVAQEPHAEIRHTEVPSSHGSMAEAPQVPVQSPHPSSQELQQPREILQGQPAVQDTPQVHAQHHIQQSTHNSHAQAYSNPENDVHIRPPPISASSDLHVSHGGESREFSGIAIREGTPSPVDVPGATGGAPANTGYVPSQPSVTSPTETPAIGISAPVSQGMQVAPPVIPQQTSSSVADPRITVTQEMHIPARALTPHSVSAVPSEPSVAITQELSVPPAALAHQQAHTGASESGIGVALQEARTDRGNELIQQRVPSEGQLQEGRREVSLTQSLSQASLHESVELPHHHVSTDVRVVMPTREVSQPQPIVFSNSVSDPPPSSARMGGHESATHRQFPQSASDGQMAPPSPITVVDIPPRPTSTPVTIPPGVDLTVEHHATPPSVAAVAYQGPEEEPRQVLRRSQQIQRPIPQARNIDRRDALNQDNRESAGNGHVQIRTQRSVQPSLPAIVVVGSTPKIVTTDAPRTAPHELAAQSLSSFPSTEALAEVSSYASSSTNGIAGIAQPIQGSVSFSSPSQAETGPSTSAASVQRSPSGKGRTNSWKSLQSDDSGNNLAPRIPLGKVIGEEHDQKYYTMCLTLMDHCAKGKVQDVLKKLEDGANPNFSDYDKRTPLHLAAAEGHVQICSLLIENGALVNPRDRWANTPLADSIENGHTEVQKLLKSHGAVDERRACFDNINMELMRAAANGNLEEVRAKIVAGADVRYADYDQRTPLHLASTEGHPEVAELLLVNGASPDSKDRKGRTPVDDAVKNGHRNILRVLRQYGAHIPRHLFEAQPELENQRGMDLIEHSARGRIEAVRKALDQGASPNFADYDRRTALHLACVEGRLEVARVLLEAGASQNVVDRWGATPSDEAKKGGFMNIVDELMVWDSKRKSRSGSAVSFDHTATVLNGREQSSPTRLDRDSQFDTLSQGIATSVSLGAMPQINLSTDDFAAKYPSSGASVVSRTEGSSISLPLTPFDMSDDFGMNNLENEERLIRQAYDAERQQLEEKHRRALEGLQRKRSVDSLKVTRVQSALSTPRASTESPPAADRRGVSDGTSDHSRGRIPGGNMAILHESLNSVPNGSQGAVQDVSGHMMGQASRTLGGSSGVTSPVQVIRPTRYPAHEAYAGRDLVPMNVNPEIRSLVDNIIDLASANR